jgi:hypothetical protein
MIRKFVGLGFVALLFFTSCGTNQSAVASALNSGSGNGSNSAGTVTAVNGQVLNPHSLPATGTYEGQGLEMVVTNSGATLNTGCTKGAVPAPIELADDGSFNTTGTMNPLLPMNPPTQTQLVLDGKYSEQDQVIAVAITYGPEGDPQNYNLVLNGPKNLEVVCPK